MSQLGVLYSVFYVLCQTYYHFHVEKDRNVSCFSLCPKILQYGAQHNQCHTHGVGARSNIVVQYCRRNTRSVVRVQTTPIGSNKKLDQDRLHSKLHEEDDCRSLRMVGEPAAVVVYSSFVVLFDRNMQRQNALFNKRVVILLPYYVVPACKLCCIMEYHSALLNQSGSRGADGGGIILSSSAPFDVAKVETRHRRQQQASELLDRRIGGDNGDILGHLLR